MKQAKKYYHNYHWIFEIETENGIRYCPDIDGSEWTTLDGAKAHIDFLAK